MKRWNGKKRGPRHKKTIAGATFRVKKQNAIRGEKGGAETAPPQGKKVPNKIGRKKGKMKVGGTGGGEKNKRGCGPIIGVWFLNGRGGKKRGCRSTRRETDSKKKKGKSKMVPDA